MRAKPFLIGLSAGIIGGLTTILFTTPQSGEQLRSNIAVNSRKTKDNLIEIKKHSNNLKEAAMSLKNEVQNNMPKIISELKGSIDNYKETIVPETEKLKEEIEGLQKSITEIEKNLSDTNNKKKNSQENQ